MIQGIGGNSDMIEGEMAFDADAHQEKILLPTVGEAS